MKTMVFEKQSFLKLMMILAVLLLGLFGTQRVMAAELSNTVEEETVTNDIVSEEGNNAEIEFADEAQIDTDVDVNIEEETDADVDDIVEEESDTDVDDIVEEESDTNVDDIAEEEADADVDDIIEEEADADVDDIIEDETDANIDVASDEEVITENEGVSVEAVALNENEMETTVSVITEQAGTVSANPSVGMVKKDGYQYYYYEAGKYYKNQFFTVNGKKYYADANGHIRNGVFKYNNDYYCANDSGVVITSPGWVTSGGKKYFVRPNGTLYCNRMLTISRTLRYYMGSNATIATGVQKTKAGYIYADPSGDGRVEYDKHWVNQNGKRYYTNGQGYLYTNHLITVSANERYYAGPQAELAAGVYKTGNNFIYADPNNDKKVQIKAGWITWNGKKYFCNGNGYLYHDQFITFGQNTRYYMGSDAAVKTGVFKVGTVYWYGDPKNDGKASIYFRNLKSGDKGIDVSYFNGTINWAKVAADGITFAFMRAGGRYGSTGEIYYDDHSGKNNNTVFITNMKNAVANGIQVGAYFFTQAINEKEAIQEAQWLVKQVKASGVKVALPLVIDTETVSSSNPGRHNSISVATRTNVIKAFCEEIERQGYTPAIYASKSWLEEKLDMSKLAYPVWVARYNSYLGYSGDYFCWQYSSSGRVNGINSSVDMNVWHN